MARRMAPLLAANDTRAVRTALREQSYAGDILHMEILDLHPPILSQPSANGPAGDPQGRDTAG